MAFRDDYAARYQAMPSRQAFDQAAKALEAKGFDHTLSVMADDARREGVENFGMLFVRKTDNSEFWLNYKTIDRIDSLAATK